MLELENVSFTIEAAGEELDLLREVGLRVAPGRFVAIIGPSGCGKTTLLKTIAGFQEQTEGRIIWNGRCVVDEDDFAPTEIGYVPQFSIAYDLLTVEESVLSAVRLRVRGLAGGSAMERVDSILAKTGLEAQRDQRVAVLSGGQKRRLGLAMELASNPHLLLCDEVTSGLDSNAEQEIVELMHSISRDDERIVLNVTHSFGGLEFYDSVIVIYAGRLVFHGPPDTLKHYFSVDREDQIYKRLGDRGALDWGQSWLKHREHYESDAGQQSGTAAVKLEAQSEIAELPGFVSQLFIVFKRRLKLFFRDRGQVLLHLAILLGFPCLVVIFAMNGVGQMPKSPLPPSDGSIFEAITNERRVIAEQMRIGGLISGIIMIQILLLTLMGSNNSSREIASERLLFEKEKFAGLRPASYLSGKVLFLTLLVVSQSVWMAVFVDRFCNLPGPFFERTVLLILANAAMTGICMGISAMMRTAEQASLMGIYLVGFQLPLSGAVLPLTNNLERFTQPFVSAYWSWAGQLELLKQTDYFVGVQRTTSTEIVSQSSMSVLVLSIHLVAGLVVAWFGLRRTQWD